MPDLQVKKLNRFTTLPVLLDILQRKKLTLLDPKLWEDKNDSELILEYKKRKDVKGLFALCFTWDDETLHHWKTYSSGPSGCAIEFNTKELFPILDGISGIRHGKVIYKKLFDAEKEAPTMNVDEIPFTKRWPYRCESEYRIIYETSDVQDFWEIDFPLECINRITISQQMPRAIYNTIEEYLKPLKGDPKKRVNQSTLYENTRWLKAFKH